MADNMPSREQMLADLNGSESRPSREQMLADLNAAQKPSTLDDIASTINSGVNGAAKWATLGYTPQIAGALSAAPTLAMDTIRGVPDMLQGYMPNYDETSAKYQKAKDDTIALEDRSWDKHPYAYGTGAVVGGVMSPINKALSPFRAAEGAGVGAKVLAGARNGVLMGAVANPGDKVGESAPLQLGERVNNAGAGALFGGGIEGVIQGAGPMAKKTISTMFGPSEESINKYLANRDMIKKAPDVATMKNMVDDQVRLLQSAVEKGEISADQAKGALKELHGQLSDVERDAGKEFSQSLPELRDSVNNAYQELGVQTAGVENQLNSVAHPRAMADDVHQAVGTLKSQVIDESGKAREILANSGDKVQIDPLRQYLKQVKESFLLDGSAPVTPEAQAAITKLEALDMNLSKLPKELKGETAKKLVQELDDALAGSYNRGQGDFSPAYDNAVKGLRREIDAQLKSNPEYAEQMSKVAEKTRLLDKANDLFGTREKAYSTMNGIHAEGKVPQREVLHALGNHTEQDFMSPLANYTKAQGQLKNMSPIVENLPAQEKVKAGETLNEIAPFLKGNYVETMARESGIPNRISAQEAEIARIQAELGQAQEKAAPFSKWGKDSTQTKLQGLVSKAPDRASIEAGRELEMLENMRTKGPDHISYQDAIDANRVRNDFSSDKTRGSKNALMWRGVGGAVGAGAGFLIPGTHHFLTPLGLGAGAAFGGYVDKNGGRIAKRALDHYLDNKAGYDFLTSRPAQNLVNPWLQMRRKDEE
jgi:polyhydroxyalkanoate synthesis regulator phasin